ncbi:MAG: GAF domain-containing sensor histidine kinase [Kovacikia sp.]
MINHDNRLFCRLDRLTFATREQQRMLVMEELGLLEPESFPIFEEAAQTAAHFLDIPIGFLGLMDLDRQRFKSSVGLSRLGLMNELATSRQFSRDESFCTYVVDSHQVLSIENTLDHSAFAGSVLTYRYGIRAYLGVPLMTSSGFCVGTLAVMDLIPRQFTDRDIQFLELMTRWVMSEVERKQPLTPQPIQPLERPSHPQASSGNTSSDKSLAIADRLKVELLGQLTQELRTPLTSVMGMASVLTHEIYGPLTHKQKEYLGIIHNSGQYLLSLVNEILELSVLKDNHQGLNLAPVDIEMICQQAINTLEQAAVRREQQIRLSLEPGRRIWLLDKDRIRQMLYHLIFSVIQSSNTGSTVRVHVSLRGSDLTIAIWVSHPWLGENLPRPEYSQSTLLPAGVNPGEEEFYGGYDHAKFEMQDSSELNIRLASSRLEEARLVTAEVGESEQFFKEKVNPKPVEESHRNLGLLLSQYLVEMHNGQITIPAASASDYRYIIKLPQVVEAGEA